MKIHPAAEIFPMMEEAELNALAESIKANGLRYPIIVDDDDTLIDGRNRLRACELAGVEPKFEKLNGQDPRALIISHNIARRHMGPGQRAMAVAMIYPKPATKAEAGAKGGRGKSSSATEQLSVPASSLSQARSVFRKDKDLAAKVLAGAPLAEAYEKVKARVKEDEPDEMGELKGRYQDLADEVVNQTKTLKQAVAEADARDEREKNRRRTLVDSATNAFRGVLAFANKEFVDGFDEPMADQKFLEEVSRFLRLDGLDANVVRRDILAGAEALVGIVNHVLSKRKGGRQ